MIFSSCQARIRDPSSAMVNSSWIGNCLMRLSGTELIRVGLFLAVADL